METKERRYNKITFYILFFLFAVISFVCLNSCKKDSKSEQKFTKHNLEFRLTSNQHLTAYSWDNNYEGSGGGLWSSTFSYYYEAYPDGVNAQTFTFKGYATDTLKAFVLVDNIIVKQSTGIDSVKIIFVYE
ncbi:hypothetical protein UFOVP916_41 [uncultured Caudovirales phage]|uniref:Uncharacterized protein n=1 Tax=uncultured Caudovirales phage TaxID=2100421 RepID=A0A6J5SGB6_9CAUD|nr:hypothetical protein UFOVP827_62 [uncultured Caudovirales phage]CAB4171470.1 hypothetical protein UFOVP916_41 [uncultured Caudovirales phage]CAB4177475.1 hypothetical protein UFOVP1001_65 [uncultured Caudovirales phage]CAB4199003.1 hypothetical protein UFOVP1338_11 [uncultured Caudovirales phage]CAB4213331.1 hypothetical protein UFOVP1447_6 [uncultured Caudovirales phage]